MVQYKRVDSAPTELKDDEIIVVTPDYKNVIEKLKFKSGVDKLTTVNYLRAIISEIALDYDPMFNVMVEFNLSQYEGRPYKTIDDLSSIVYEIIQKQHPEIIKKNLKDQFKNIDPSVNLIYFVAKDQTNSDVFTNQKIMMYNPSKAKNQKKQNDLVLDENKE
jgi:hypothetical protein